MAQNAGSFLSDKQYNFVKFLTVTFLPAVGTLYFALASTWGLPAPEQVLGTCLSVQAFIAVIMGISTKQYQNSDARFDGAVTIAETPEKHIVAVEGIHPDDMAKKDEVLLKVKDSSQ